MRLWGYEVVRFWGCSLSIRNFRNGLSVGGFGMF